MDYEQMVGQAYEDIREADRIMREQTAFFYKEIEKLYGEEDDETIEY